MGTPWRRIWIPAAAGLVLLGFMARSAPAQVTTSTNLFTRSFNQQNHYLFLRPAQRWGMFRVSDQISIYVTTHSPVRIFTLQGETVYEGSSGMLPHLPVGHYFVETEGDRAQFAVLPDDYKGASFLGTECDGGNNSSISAKLKLIGPAWVRVLGEGFWEIVQPVRGFWDWERLDRVVEVNAGRRIIVNAFHRPPWVGDDEFIPLFAQYVRQTARRYRGKIYAIEIWNEPYHVTDDTAARLPHVSTTRDLVDFYARLLQASRFAIKSVAPEMKVFGPTFSCPLKIETDGLAEIGALNNLDAFSWHDYRMNEFPPDADRGNWKSVDQYLERLRTLVPLKSLIVDELGLWNESPLGTLNLKGGDNVCDWKTACERAVKMTVMLRGGGVECILPHNFVGGGGHKLDGVDPSNRGPQPKSSTFLMTCYWLNGAKGAGHRVIGGRAFFYAWTRPDGSTLVFAWCTEGNTIGFHPANAWRTTDIFGQAVATQTLSEEPVLIWAAKADVPALTLDAVAAAMVQ
jgi:hypothetical protein